jgi:hypothetical protein
MFSNFAFNVILRPYNKICYACNQNTLCDEINQVVPKSLTQGYW